MCVYILDVLTKHSLTFLVVSLFIGEPGSKTIDYGSKMNCGMKVVNDGVGN